MLVFWFGLMINDYGLKEGLKMAFGIPLLIAFMGLIIGFVFYCFKIVIFG